ncbi:MAG: site-specific integrase [Rhodoblastus sp.]|nr:site-specific integrase [Rhodoblastus sp.]MCB9999813.1 site-specific integrase [Methylobacteriaceae bacterium]
MPLKIVKRRKSKFWVIRGTISGIRYEESTQTSDKALAEEMRAAREAELFKEKVYGKVATVTFAHAVADYLEHGRGDKRHMAPVLAHFGTTLLRHVDQHAIDMAAMKLLPNAGPATRDRQVYGIVSKVLHHAARKGWCNTPIIARPKKPKGVVRWITPDEAEQLIANCSPHLRPLVIFLLYTGARAGEALWLDWKNVNLETPQVTFPRTKNGDPRSVPLHPRVVHELAALNHREDEVFRTASGEPYARPKRADDTSAGTRIRTGFAAACRRAGIANFRVHDCRHTWATWHYQLNRDLAKLQALGGWKTPTMVFRYAHSNVEQHAESIAKLPWNATGGELGENRPKKSGK